MSFAAGTHVVIVARETLSRNHPELIGRTGIIASGTVSKESGSWFKVRVPSLNKTVKLRSKSFTPLKTGKPMNVSSMVVGTHVEILETENVLSRCPEYIGKVGVVKEAPGDKIIEKYERLNCIVAMSEYQVFILLSASCHVV
jgi:hypothetical protein